MNYSIATGIARKLLDTPDLDTTSAQIRALCRNELEIVCDSGRFEQGSLLLGIMTSIRAMLQADTQSIESANSIVRIISARCRKISLELLSSRLMIKYALGGYSDINRSSSSCSTSDDSQLQLKDFDGNKTSKLVRKKIQKGETLLDEMKPFANAFEFDASVERWAPPTLVPLAISQEQIVAAHPFMKVKPTDVWASSYATALRRCLNQKKRKNAKACKTDASHGQSSSSSGACHARSVEEASVSWPLLIVSLLQKADAPTDRQEVISVNWYLWIGNYRYTMSFMELFLLDENCDAESFNAIDARKLIKLKFRPGHEMVDGAFLFSQHAAAVQRGACVKVERVLLPPSCICAGVIPTADEIRNALMDNGSLGLVFADLILATLAVQDMQRLTLFTATKEPHASVGLQPQKKSKEKEPSAVKRKHGKPEKAESDDTDPLADLAALAAAELHGDVGDGANSEDDDDMDSDDEFVSGKQSHGIVASNNLAKIQVAVKTGACPPDEAIANVAEIIRHWPQFADLNPTDLEEQALILCLSGVTKQDVEITDAVSQAGHSASGSASASASGSSSDAATAAVPSDPTIAPISSSVAVQLKEDLNLPTATTFVECNAVKPRGPGSLPTGKDFCKSKDIYVASASAEAFNEWQRNIHLAIEAIHFRESHHKDSLGENLSLVLIHQTSHDDTARLMYVHWLKHNPGHARQAQLDQHGKVIFSMAWAYQPVKLTGAESKKNTVILPDVGVPMLKVRSHERPQVCEAVRRLEDMLNTIILHCLPDEDRQTDTVV